MSKSFYKLYVKILAALKSTPVNHHHKLAETNIKRQNTNEIDSFRVTAVLLFACKLTKFGEV